MIAATARTRASGRQSTAPDVAGQSPGGSMPMPRSSPRVGDASVSRSRRSRSRAYVASCSACWRSAARASISVMKGAALAGGEVSLTSCCVHDLGRVLDALSQPSSAPERRFGEGGVAGSQFGLGGPEVGLGGGEGPEEGLGALSCIVECSPSDRDSLLGRLQVVRRAANSGDLGGQVPSLRDGGGVGAVVGEDLFEDVARLAGFVGDDEDPVLGAASGGGDVEAAVGGGGRDDADADVDGVALVAVGGGGVAEPDVRSGVVGGERHLTVPVEM